MISLKYNVSTTPVIAETYLNPTTSDQAYIYIDKKEGFNTLELTVKDEIDLPTIHKVTFSGRKHKVYANTTRIIASNVVINNEVMYYKLVSLFDEPFTLDDVILNSSVHCIEHNGILYTNEKVDNVEIKSNVYIFSVPAVELNKNVSYTSKHIVIEFDYDKNNLHFKCENESLISFTLINNSKVHIDSFYTVKNGRKVFQCIEGDVVNVDKEEIVLHAGNSINVKDKIHSIPFGFFSERTNKIYTLNTHAEAGSVINYVATKSSHVFYLDKEVTYFKITDIGLEKGTEKDHDFSLRHKVDSTKINVITSKYLNKIIYDFIHKDVVIIENEIRDFLRKVALKQYVNSYLTIPPSETVYISEDDKKIYQSKNSLDIEDIEVVEDDYSMEEYEFLVNSYLETKTIKVIDNVNYYM